MKLDVMGINTLVCSLRYSFVPRSYRNITLAYLYPLLHHRFIIYYYFPVILHGVYFLGKRFIYLVKNQ